MSWLSGRGGVKPPPNHNHVPIPKPSRLDLLKEPKPSVAPSSPPLCVHHHHYPPSPPPTPHTPHNQYTSQKPLTPSFLPNRQLAHPVTPGVVHHPTAVTNNDFIDYQQVRTSVVAVARNTVDMEIRAKCC